MLGRVNKLSSKENSMKYLKLAIIILLCFKSQAYAQNIDDELLWNWTRVQGTFDSPYLPDHLEDRLLGSVEFHYRMNNNASEFQNLILRPMMGYRLKDQSVLWIGYAYIAADSQNGVVHEQRLFQMISYGHKFEKLPVVFVGNTRVEERFFENSDQVAFRLRQMLRVSIDLFKIKETQFSVFIQNEYFHSLNRTDRVQTAGFDQNRALIGVGVRGNILNTPVDFNIGYMRNLNFQNQVTHGINVGVSITIPHKKPHKKPRRRKR